MNTSTAAWFERAPFCTDHLGDLDLLHLSQEFYRGSRTPGFPLLEILVPELPPSIRGCLAVACSGMERRCRELFPDTDMFFTHGVLCRRPGSVRQDTHRDGGICTLLLPLSGPVAPTLLWPSVGEWCCTTRAPLPPRARASLWDTGTVQFIGARRYHAGPGNDSPVPQFILYTHAQHTP